MAHVIPFRLPDPAKSPKREITANAEPAKVTYLGALKRPAPARAD